MKFSLFDVFLIPLQGPQVFVKFLSVNPSAIKVYERKLLHCQIILPPFRQLQAIVSFFFHFIFILIFKLNVNEQMSGGSWNLKVTFDYEFKKRDKSRRNR